MGRYTEQELRDIFFDALDFFNDALDSGITRDNTVLAFFTPVSAPVIKCKKTPRKKCRFVAEEAKKR